MAEGNAAEGGGVPPEAPAEDSASAATVPPAPEPISPVDAPEAAATPRNVDPFSIAASTLGHLLVGLVVFGSLSSVQKPPDVIPVKLIPADQAPEKPKKPPEPQPAPKPPEAQPAPGQPPSPPPPKASAEPGKPQLESPKPSPAGAAKPKQQERPLKDTAGSPGLADYGRKTTLPDAVLAALSAQVKRCWTVPTGWSDPRQVTVTLRFQLQEDGSLNGDPAVVEFPATPLGAASAKAAIAAISQCGPFHLPAAEYEQWKDVQLKLEP